VKLGRGAVIVVELDPTLGHEQHGVRPCVVVSDPDSRVATNPATTVLEFFGTRLLAEWSGNDIGRYTHWHGG
jgi:mRNA-degrading endonuclease toxin of MazEF toxin-antitoxin module